MHLLQEDPSISAQHYKKWGYLMVPYDNVTALMKKVVKLKTLQSPKTKQITSTS